MISKSVIVATPVLHLSEVMIALRREFSDLRIVRFEQLYGFLADRRADAVFVNPNRQSGIIGPEILRNVGMVCTASTGTDHIDMEAAESLGVKVTCLRNDPVIYNLPGTAELALALTLDLVRNVSRGSRSVAIGTWTYLPFMGREIRELTFGVVGIGRLGSMYDKMVTGLGGKVIWCDPHKEEDSWNRKRDLHDLLQESDVISLHVHSQGNDHLIGAPEMALMKRGALLVNTSRASVVDESAIIPYLESGWLGGYATDVLSDENGRVSSTAAKLRSMLSSAQFNVVITPHVGGMTLEGQTRAYLRMVEKMREALS